MQSIITKYLGATNHRQARIKARASGGCSMRLMPYDYSLSAAGNHMAAAAMLARHLRWAGTWHMGALTADSCVFVRVHADLPLDSFTVEPQP